jgi:hypothetical protein
MKVCKLDDIEYWAGESLAACIAEARRVCGADCYEDAEECGYELTDVQMREMYFRDEDGSTRTFAEELQLRIEDGGVFPQHFAASEW